MSDVIKEKRARLDRRTIRVVLSRLHALIGLGFLLYADGFGAQHIFQNEVLWGVLNLLMAVGLVFSKSPPLVSIVVKIGSATMLSVLAYAYLEGGVMTAVIYAGLALSALEGVYLAGLDLYKKGPHYASRPD